MQKSPVDLFVMLDCPYGSMYLSPIIKLPTTSVE